MMTPEELIAELDRIAEGGEHRTAFVVVVRYVIEGQDSIEYVDSHDPDRLDELKKKLRAGAEPVGVLVRDVNRVGTQTVWSKVFDETNERHVTSLHLLEYVGMIQWPDRSI